VKSRFCDSYAAVDQSGQIVISARTSSSQELSDDQRGPRTSGARPGFCGSRSALWLCVILRDHRYLSDSSCAWIGLATSNDVIDTHVSGRCINSIFRYASTILLLNSPSYSNAISTFNDGRKPLHLANVDSRLRRIDGYGDRCLLHTLARSWRERKSEGQQQSDFYDRLEVARHWPPPIRSLPSSDHMCGKSLS
jgi:hypothetical protein